MSRNIILHKYWYFILDRCYNLLIWHFKSVLWQNFITLTGNSITDVSQEFFFFLILWNHKMKTLWYIPLNKSLLINVTHSWILAASIFSIWYHSTNLFSLRRTSICAGSVSYKDLKKIETGTWNLILRMTASNLQTSWRHSQSDAQSLPRLFSLSDLSEQNNIT